MICSRSARIPTAGQKAGWQTVIWIATCWQIPPKLGPLLMHIPHSVLNVLRVAGRCDIALRSSFTRLHRPPSGSVQATGSDVDIRHPFSTENLCRAYNFSGFAAGIIKGHSSGHGCILNYNILLYFPYLKMADDRTPFLCLPELDWRLLARHGEITISDLDEIFWQQASADCGVMRPILRKSYIYTTLDLYYIPGSISHGTNHFLHDILLLGWNPQQSTVTLTCGFDGQGKYAIVSLPLSHLALSLKSTRARQLRAKASTRSYVIGYNPGGPPALDLNLIGKQLVNYRHGRSCADLGIAVPETARSYEPTESNGLYGLDVYDILNVYFDYKIYHRKFLDLRATRLLWEHKMLMVERLRVCSRLGLKVPGRSISIYEQVAEIAKKIHMTFYFWQSGRTDGAELRSVLPMLAPLRSLESEALDAILGGSASSFP